MNERIRELWDKAAQAAAAYPSGQNNSWETQVNFMEKFAELIVKKCMAVAKYHTPDTEECEHTWLIHDKIGKHFGVEE